MDKNNTLLQVEEALQKIKDKNSKIYFYVANMVGIEGSTTVTYRHAKTLHDNGYKVTMLHDNLEYKRPTFLGEWVNDIEHIALNKNRNKVKVSVSDMLVYPETHPDVIEKTKALNCIKVVLVQSHSRLLNSLAPTMTYEKLGVDSILTTTKELKSYIESMFGTNIMVDTITPSVDDSIFYDRGLYRKPTIAVYSRNQMDTLKLAKEFYAKNPKYTMFAFKDMRDLTKEGFAQSLSESFLSVWNDRDASFPMYAIESIKTKTPTLALIPDMVTEAFDMGGTFLATTPLELVDMVTYCAEHYMLNKDFDGDIKDNVETISKLYKTEDEEKEILEVYGKLFNRKGIEIENYYNKIKSENE